MSYFCSYCQPKIQSPKEKNGDPIHGPKRKIKLHYYLQTNQWPKLIGALLCRVQLSFTLLGFFWPLPLWLGLYYHLISLSPSQIVSKPANHFILCHYHSFSYRLRILAFLIYNYNHSCLYVHWCYWDIHKALNIAKVLVFNSSESFQFLGCGCLIIPND